MTQLPKSVPPTRSLPVLVDDLKLARVWVSPCTPSCWLVLLSHISDTHTCKAKTRNRWITHTVRYGRQHIGGVNTGSHQGNGLRFRQAPRFGSCKTIANSQDRQRFRLNCIRQVSIFRTSLLTGSDRQGVHLISIRNPSQYLCSVQTITPIPRPLSIQIPELSPL